MVAEQKEFGRETAEYLESNEVYDLFSYMLREVIANQPAKLYEHLRQILRRKPPVCACVLGPPGMNRAKYAAALAKKFGVAHIAVGQMLAALAKQKPQVADDINAGNLVDNDMVIGVVKAEIQRYNKTGWILEGFPRTKIQAQAICTRETGFPLDAVILLHTGEKAIMDNFASKIAPASLSQPDREDLIQSRFQQYQRHVISVAELFKNVVRHIEVTGGDAGLQAVVEVMAGNIPLRKHANAPLRPSRVCIVGACASGRTTVARTIAVQKGVVHVEVAKLLRNQTRGNAGEPIPPEWVSDEEVCALVGSRLNETDCRRRGWVLDGFPRTPGQAEFLRQSHLWPSRVVHLRVSADVAAQRIANRKIDPLTGSVYYKSPNNPKIEERLRQAACDSPENIVGRIKLHMENVDKTLQAFRVVASHVNGDNEEGDVVAAVLENIDEPLPSELAQDMSENS